MATLRALPVDAPVRWKEGFKPALFPHTRGTVFLSKGRETWVRWDGAGAMPSLVFTGALEVVR